MKRAVHLLLVSNKCHTGWRTGERAEEGRGVRWGGGGGGKEGRKNKESPHRLWDIIKKNNLCIPGVPEAEENEKGEVSLKK